jgi:hypothetical protein
VREKHTCKGMCGAESTGWCCCIVATQYMMLRTGDVACAGTHSSSAYKFSTQSGQRKVHARPQAHLVVVAVVRLGGLVCGGVACSRQQRQCQASIRTVVGSARCMLHLNPRLAPSGQLCMCVQLVLFVLNHRFEAGLSRHENARAHATATCEYPSYGAVRVSLLCTYTTGATGRCQRG